MGGEWFNSSWLKKTDKPDNYVEITPEQQAQIDAEKVARDNEKLTKGLSGTNSSLGKGVTVETSGPKRIDTGNGITRIENPDGTTEFEIDCKKYDGTPQLFSKDTKVTYINQPPKENVPLHKQALNWWDKNVTEPLNEWGSKISGGYIRSFGRGVNTLGGATLGGIGLSAIGSAGTATATATTVLASCSKKDDPLHPENASVNLEITANKIADDAINFLNGENPISQLDGKHYTRKTPDGEEFLYSYTHKVENGAEKIGGFINMGEEPNKIQLDLFSDCKINAENTVKYINIIDDKPEPNVDGLNYTYALDNKKPIIKLDGGISLPIKTDETIGGETVVKYINVVDEKNGTTHQTVDEIGYKYGIADGKVGITIGKDGKEITVPINRPGTGEVGTPNPKDVVNYINIIGDEKQTTTEPPVGYTYNVVDGKAQVEFGNGFKHNLGEPVNNNPNGAVETFKGMLEGVGFNFDNLKGKNGSEEFLTNISLGNTSYSNAPGLKFEVIPGTLSDLAAGNPQVKLTLDNNNSITGTFTKNADGSITVTDGSKKLTIQNVQDFEVGAEGQYSETWNGVLLTLEGGEKPVQYMLTKYGDGKHVSYSLIDREWGSAEEFCPIETIDGFDAKTAKTDVEKYFDEKQANLKDAIDDAQQYYDDKNQILEQTRDEAEEFYDEKNQNLVDTREQAENDFIEVMQVICSASADARVTIRDGFLWFK